MSDDPVPKCPNVSSCLSVVVPVFNERDSVTLLVHEIISALRDRAHSEGGDFEIVYVDDHSDDGTLSVLRALKEHVSELRVICQRRAGWSKRRDTRRR